MGHQVASCQMRSLRRGIVWVGGCLAFGQGFQPIFARRRTLLFWSGPPTCSAGFDEVIFDEIFQVCGWLFGRVPMSHLHTGESRLQQLGRQWAWWFVLAQDCRRLLWISSCMLRGSLWFGYRRLFQSMHLMLVHYKGIESVQHSPGPVCWWCILTPSGC